MTTLYFSPQPTRSARARWAFIEAGVAFDAQTVDVFAGEQKAPEYLAVNPRGVVPTAVFGDTAVGESSALALAAAIEHDARGLIPSVGTIGWREALQWAVFAPAELDHFLVTLNNQRLFLPPEARNADLKQQTLDALATRYDIVLDRLDARPYLLGDTFSVADICVGHSLVWGHMHGLTDIRPRAKPYLDRLQARPAFLEVYGPKLQVMPDPHAV